MPEKIQAPGVYRGIILESALGVTKSEKPQWVGKIAIHEKWVDSPTELAELGREEPCWADCSSHGLETTAFLMLFNSTEEFSDETAMANYAQLKLVTGWDGTEFDSLTDDAFVGKQILCRLEFGTDYINDKGVEVAGQLRCQWIDAYDASPVRQLKSVDADKVKALSAKLKFSKAIKVATIAKPVAAKPAATEPVAVKPPATKPAATKPAATKVPPKTSAPVVVEEAVVEEEVAAEITPLDQGAAWEFVCNNSNGALAAVIEKTWIEQTKAVLGDRGVDDSVLTNDDWGQIAVSVIAELA